MSREPHPCTDPIEAIEAAIRSLSDVDWHRLRQASRILAAKAPGLEAESLLFGALERTLDGRRTWSPGKVDFVGYVIGIMRSLASHELTRRGINTVCLTSSVQLLGRGDPEGAVSAKQQIQSLRDYFCNRQDALALAVLDGMELGCDGSTLRAQLGLGQRDLETVVRRIRRAAVKVLPP